MGTKQLAELGKCRNGLRSGPAEVRAAQMSTWCPQLPCLLRCLMLSRGSWRVMLDLLLSLADEVVPSSLVRRCPPSGETKAGFMSEETLHERCKGQATWQGMSPQNTNCEMWISLTVLIFWTENFGCELRFSNDCVARGGLLLPPFRQAARFGFYSCEMMIDCWPTLRGQKKLFQWNLR